MVMTTTKWLDLQTAWIDLMGLQGEDTGATEPEEISRCPCCDAVPPCSCTMCPDCKGIGVLALFTTRDYCDTCDGSGWV